MARKMDDADHNSYAVIDLWAEQDVDGADMDKLADAIASALREAGKRGFTRGLRHASAKALSYAERELYDELIAAADELENQA